FFFQAEDGIRDWSVTGVQTCALPISLLGSALLIAAPGVNLLYLGRQVLGEVPGLAFLMLGVFFWTRSAERAGGWWRDLFLASIEIGRASCRERVEVWGVGGVGREKRW